MSFSYLIDAQLPPGLASKLKLTGRVAVHVTEILPSEASDLQVAEAAMKQNAILVSKDDDFVELSQRGILASPLLWVRVGNTTNERLWLVLQSLLDDAEKSFSAGEKIVEIQ